MLKGAGGTEGGIGQFLIGLVMMVAGFYLLLSDDSQPFRTCGNADRTETAADFRERRPFIGKKLYDLQPADCRQAPWSAPLLNF